MAGLTQTEQQATLDARFPTTGGTDYVAYSATATGAVTVTHFAVYSASTGGTQRTDWQALAASKTLAIGDSLQWAVGACAITLD